MFYRIKAKVRQADKSTARLWYAGRKTGVPRFELNADQAQVLQYYHLENAVADKTYLETMPELCEEVEIVTFDEAGLLADKGETAAGQHTDTIELEQESALEILLDAQEILTKVVAPGMHAEISKEIAHEQLRTALSLLLKAISVLKKEAPQSRRQEPA